MINVTKSFLPPYEEYEVYLKQIWESSYLTNNGPCVQQLEQQMRDYLKTDYFHYVSNGTVALQLALHALDIMGGEVITTPFSFVATTTSILWEHCTPVFVDIDPHTFCIDPLKIEEKITDQTKAIMAVHVFGYPCAVDEIEQIAKKHHLKVIYDAAHAFGCVYKGKSLLCYGDVSTCSFHATKVNHTIEGGAVIAKEKSVSDKLKLMRQFGYVQEDYQEMGINAKCSEVHAAMGLTNFPHLDDVILKRKRISERYDDLLDGLVTRPCEVEDLVYNYAYYPVLFENEQQLLRVFESLNREQIYPRRYFYPSLNTLPYLKEHSICPISEDISSRIACLPLYPMLTEEEVVHICDLIKQAL